MDLRVGDVVVCEDWVTEREDGIYYGRVVGPEDKHEVRQCRTTGHVVVQTLRGVDRYITDRNGVIRKLTRDEVRLAERAGWPAKLSKLNSALRLFLN